MRASQLSCYAVPGCGVGWLVWCVSDNQLVWIGPHSRKGWGLVDLRAQAECVGGEGGGMSYCGRRVWHCSASAGLAIYLFLDYLVIYLPITLNHSFVCGPLLCSPCSGVEVHQHALCRCFTRGFEYGSMLVLGLDQY
jgi:hypothetical protein